MVTSDNQARCTAISHLAIRWWMSTRLKWFEVPWRVLFSSGTELGRCERAASCLYVLMWKGCKLPSISHTCSIGFRTGKFVGHNICWMFSVSRKSSFINVQWQGALSSMNMNSGPTAPRNKPKAQELCLCIFDQSQTPCQKNGVLCGLQTWCAYPYHLSPWLKIMSCHCFLVQNVFHILSILLPDEIHYSD